MDRVVFRPEPSSVSANLKLGSLAGALSLNKLIETAILTARPSAAYALIEPVVNGRDSVEVAGEVLSSRILRVNPG